MKDDLIRRQSAINAIENTDVPMSAGEWDELTDAIVSIPAVDAVEVRHGWWVVLSSDHTFSDGIKARWNIWKCSRCPYVRTSGWEYTTEGQKPKARYCENCGARMDG